MGRDLWTLIDPCGVLGEGRGTIPDLWFGCSHTFSSLSRCDKSVEIADIPEPILCGGRTLVWKVASGGAKKENHFAVFALKIDPYSHRAQCVIDYDNVQAEGESVMLPHDTVHKVGLETRRK